MDFKRGKSKYTSNYDSRDIYYFFKKYTKMYPRFKIKFLAPSEKQFKTVFKKFAERVSDEIVENFFSFKMPYGLGSIYIHNYKYNYRLNDDGNLKIKRTMIDIVATRTLWATEAEEKKKKTLVLKDYSNTDDVIYKIRWSKPHLKFVNNKFYLFKPSRKFKIKVYEACIDGTITSYN